MAATLKWAPSMRSSALVMTIAGASALLGWQSWRPGGQPALCMFAPLLWAFAHNRTVAATAGFCYCLSVVSFLPAMAGSWYSSDLTGYVLWVSVGLAGGALFATTWSGSNKWLRCGFGALTLLALWLVLGVAIPGHPLFAWGYVLPGWGWNGVLVALALTTLATTLVRVSRPYGMLWLPTITAVLVVGMLGHSYRVDARAVTGKLSEHEPVVAVSTAWGSYPAPSSPAIESRFEGIASVVDTFARAGQSVTLVFPEAVLGEYDSSIGTKLQEIVDKARQRADIALVVGMDLPLGDHRFGNAASVFRAGEEVAWILARQSTPIAQWRPWSTDMHFPSNWLASTAMQLGSGQRVALLFCHEEYSGALHLLLQWRDRPSAIIVLSNLWAAPNETADSVQAAHTEGVVRLFGQTLYRAVNLPVGPGPASWISTPRR